MATRTNGTNVLSVSKIHSKLGTLHTHAARSLWWSRLRVPIHFLRVAVQRQARLEQQISGHKSGPLLA